MISTAVSTSPYKIFELSNFDFDPNCKIDTTGLPILGLHHIKPQEFDILKPGNTIVLPRQDTKHYLIIEIQSPNDKDPIGKIIVGKIPTQR
jgi:hypothetical protein